MSRAKDKLFNPSIDTHSVFKESQPSSPATPGPKSLSTLKPTSASKPNPPKTKDKVFTMSLDSEPKTPITGSPLHSTTISPKTRLRENLDRLSLVVTDMLVAFGAANPKDQEIDTEDYRITHLQELLKSLYKEAQKGREAVVTIILYIDTFSFVHYSPLKIFYLFII